MLHELPTRRLGTELEGLKPAGVKMSRAELSCCTGGTRLCRHRVGLALIDCFICFSDTRDEHKVNLSSFAFSCCRIATRLRSELDL